MQLAANDLHLDASQATIANFISSYLDQGYTKEVIGHMVQFKMLENDCNMTPYPQQQSIVDALFRGAKRIAQASGRRTGKSQLANLVGISYLSSDECGGLPNRLVCVAAPTSELTMKVFKLAWKYIVQKQIFGYAPVKKSYEQKYIEMPWGARLEGKTADNPDSLVGDGVAFYICDEFQKFKDGVFDMYIMPSLTDLSAPAWLIGTPRGVGNEWFLKFHDWTYKMKLGDNRYFTAIWDSYKNPYIKKEDLDLLKLEMSPDVFDQEIMANWKAMSNSVYPMFDADKHVGEFPVVNDVPFTVGLDWGFSAPCACTFTQWFPDESSRVVDSFATKGLYYDEIASKIKTTLAKYKADHDYCFCDPSDPRAVGALRKGGIRSISKTSTVNKKLNNVQSGLDCCRMLFQREPNQGGILIHPRNLELIKCLQTYRIEKDEKPLKEDDHLPDALRYQAHGKMLMYSRGKLEWVSTGRR